MYNLKVDNIRSLNLLPNMKIIDKNTWNRKSQYENFITYSNPTFSLGTRLDVTNLVNYCKKTNKSFFVCFLYVLSKAINAVPEMRTRILNDNPVSFDVVHPSFIVMRPDEVIVTCQTDFTNDFNEFYNDAINGIEEKRNSLNNSPFESSNGVDCFYVSAIKWMDLTSVINPYNFDNSNQSSIPRITWGKFVKNGESKYEMGFDVSVHHALIDGYQVTKVVSYITDMINDIDKILGEN